MSKNKFFELKGSNGIHIVPNPKVGPFLGCFLFAALSVVYFNLWPLAVSFFLFKSGVLYYVRDSCFTMYLFLSIAAFLICLPPCFQSAAFQTDEMLSERKPLNNVSLSKRDLIYLFAFLFIIPLFISLLLYPPIWGGAGEQTMNYKNLRQYLDFYMYINSVTLPGLVGATAFLAAYYFAYVFWVFDFIPIRFTLYLQQTIWKVNNNRKDELPQ